MKNTVKFACIFSMLIGLMIESVLAEPASDVEYLTSEATRKANLPFSEAVRVGNILYLSGQLGIDPATGKLAKGGVAGETRQTLENIKTTLERYNSSLDKVFKCTVFIDDMSKWPDLNKVYVSYFKNQLPARSALGADGLALGAALEIECMAVIKK